MPKEVENAIWGALLTGGLGAVAGGLATKPDENLTPGEQFKQRLKNALMVGLMGAAGGGGAGYLLTNAGIVDTKGGDTPKPEPTAEQLNNERWQRNGGAIVGGVALGTGVGKLENAIESHLNDGGKWKPKGKFGRFSKGVYRASPYAAGLTVVPMIREAINNYQHQSEQ